MPLKQLLKEKTPESIWMAASDTRYALQRATMWPSARFHPVRRTSRHKLARLKDAHHGKRCFIIGNGPSLKNTDLSLLKDEFTFGMNRIYLIFPELGFSTSYYLSVNSLVIEQCAKEIASLSIPTFLSWRSRKLISPSEEIIFLHTTYSGPKFALDARERLWEGATVTYVALQLAYHMGFQQVILIGVDHNFSTRGTPNTTVTSTGDDPDHFDARYFGKGYRWQLPDLATSERGYSMAQQVYTQNGRQILDATVDGKLDIFPKVPYLSLFS